MPKVAIMTDSNSGITQKEAKEIGVTVVPMPFTINGEEYLEDINLTTNQFFDLLNSGADVSTSQPSIGYVNSIWDELLEEYDEVVYMPMTSGLSKSCETARLSAEANYNGKVFVVDNKRISVPLKQAIYDCLELKKRGYTGAQIKEYSEKVMWYSDIYIMLDTLKHLRKGGRITPAAAAVGTMLNIKPILLIKGEKLDKYKMLNRTLENAKRQMIAQCKEHQFGYMKDIDGRTDNVWYEVAYTGKDDTKAQEFKMQIAEAVGVDPDTIIVNPLALSIACHTGDGAIAMAITKKLLD